MLRIAIGCAFVVVTRWGVGISQGSMRETGVGIKEAQSGGYFLTSGQVGEVKRPSPGVVGALFGFFAYDSVDL